ncbi:MAG: hypothetical protein Q9191_003064 [Dirinaria sp. TL-2023a]
MTPRSPAQSSFQPTIGSTWEVPRLYKDKIHRENTRPLTAGGASPPSTRPAFERSTGVSLHGHRSKSSTAIPNLKNFGLRLSPTSSVEMSTSRYSLDARSISGSLHFQAERSEGLARSLRAKGSRLIRRQNSKFNLPTLEWDESAEQLRSRGNGGQSRVNSVDNSKPPIQHAIVPLFTIAADTAWRPDISEPYNFQHLTHTHARHFQQIDRASHHDLVSEFSAIRASQAPRRELQGIKAEFLQSRVLRSEPTSPARRSLISPPSLSPVRSTFASPARSPNHHYSQSADYFSQKDASSQSRDRAATSPVSPSARYIPRAAAPEVFDQHQWPGSTEEFGRDSPTHDYSAYDFAESQYVTAYPSPTDATLGFVDYASLPHAVTTPDNTAMTLTPSSSRPTGAELADVPEEDEQGTAVISSRPSTAGSGLRHAKSFPTIHSRSNSQPWSRSPHKPHTRDSDSLSEGRLSHSEIMLPLVGDEADDVPVRPRVSRQQSLKTQGLDACWEDDIDYCYEHAAEADCDFDWDRISSKDVEGVTVAAPSTSGNDPTSERYEDIQQVSSPEEPQPHLLPRIQTSIPVPSLCSTNSAKSSLSSLNGPVTPSFPLPSPQTYGLGPHIIPPKESNMLLGDEAYENIFFNKTFSSENLPLQNHRFEALTDTSRESSPRSSRSPISKSNSQESFRISRSSSLRYPRSMGSMTSLPDLVHSKSSRDGLNISAEQAAELAATLKASESFLDLQHSPLKPKINHLLKDAARQSMAQKAAGFGSLEEEEHIGDEVVVLPSLSNHERSLSAITERNPIQASLQRKRSVSSATAAGPKNNSFSYSLFPLPPTAVRSP